VPNVTTLIVVNRMALTRVTLALPLLGGKSRASAGIFLMSTPAVDQREK